MASIHNVREMDMLVDYGGLRAGIDLEETADEADGESAGPTARSVASRSQRKKKVEFLDHILRNLDILIYCQICVLFYMDVSFFRLFVRSSVQLTLLTPKPKDFPQMKRKPYVVAILGSNIICILLHLLYRPPEAGEATRHYLHGGVFLDFIGQESPVSRLRLLLNDFLTMALQIVMFAAHILRLQMRMKPDLVDATTPAATEVADENIPRQDVESEEQGLLRPSVVPSANADSIELHNLSSLDRAMPDSFEDPSQSSSNSSAHPLDPFHTGELIVADLHVFENIRIQFQEYQIYRQSLRARVQARRAANQLNFDGGRAALSVELLRQILQDSQTRDLRIGG